MYDHHYLFITDQ